MKAKSLSILIALAACSLGAIAGATQEKAPQWPMFRKHHLDAGANEAAAVADLNQDGRLDIVAGENWFAAPEWKKHRLREIGFTNGYIDDFSNLTLDVNGDNFPDVLGCAWFSKKLVWLENPRRFDGELANVLWREHVIETGFNYELMIMADVDGDGKAQEVVPNYGSSGEVVWFELNKAAKGQFIRHAVGRVPEVRGLHGNGVGDVNGDKRPDFITPRGWFEAPADPRAGAWNFHAEFRLLPSGQCSQIGVLDVNGDGRNDLVYGFGHGYGLFWSENKGGGAWPQHLIDDGWSQPHAVTLADLDGDGKLDLVTAKRYLAHDTDPGAYEPLGLYWYRLGEGGRFVKHVIDFGGKTGGGNQIPVVDLDGDGDLDIVTPGKSGLFLCEQINFQRQKAK